MMKSTPPSLRPVIEALSAAYSKADLNQYFYPVIQKMLKDHSDTFLRLGFSARQQSDFANLKSPNKEALAEVVALGFFHADAYKAWLASLTPLHRNLWEALAGSRYISHVELKEKYQIESVYAYTPNWLSIYINANQYILPEFRIFFEILRPGKLRGLFYFSIPPPLRHILKTYLPVPEKAQLIPVKDPGTGYYRYIASDAQFFSEWQRILSGIHNLYFNFNAKGRPVTVPKTAKALKLKEFFPEAEPRHRILRTTLLCGIIARADVRKLSESGLDSIAYLMGEVYTQRTLSAPWLLTDIKGVNILKNIEFGHVEEGMFRLLKALPGEEWIEADRIYAYAQHHGLLAAPFRKRVESLHLEIMEGDDYEYDTDDLSIHSENEEEWIFRAIVNGSMFLFSAFGLVDLAYQLPLKDGAPVWNALAYVRRNALGDFITGHRGDYQVALPEEETRPIISEDGLLVTLPDDAHPLANLLEPYMERVGVGKYQSSAAKFLKGVRNRQELQSRIRLFRQVIGTSLPENWQHFLKDLEGKVDPLKPLPEYLVYQIPPEDKALIQLFGKDPVLQKIIIKAEGFRVLFPQNKASDLRKRLRELGYLMS
jgi:hypothetical protein